MRFLLFSYISKLLFDSQYNRLIDLFFSINGTYMKLLMKERWLLLLLMINCEFTKMYSNILYAMIFAINNTTDLIKMSATARTVLIPKYVNYILDKLFEYFKYNFRPPFSFVIILI